MTKPNTGPKSPNQKIDRALKKLLALLDEKDNEKKIPIDDAVRIVNSAIAWEKVRNSLQEKEPFDPDSI